MKFKNVSEKHKHFKLKGEFIIIAPGETKDFPMEIVEDGMELVQEVKQVSKKKVVKDKPKSTAVEANITTPEKAEVKNELDLNNDGKVDKKDSSIAGKVLANAKKMNRAIKKQINK